MLFFESDENETSYADRGTQASGASPCPGLRDFYSVGSGGSH